MSERARKVLISLLLSVSVGACFPDAPERGGDVGDGVDTLLEADTATSTIEADTAAPLEDTETPDSAVDSAGEDTSSADAADTTADGVTGPCAGGPGTSCDDGNPCTVDDACDAGGK
ncbi:MAG: hypothetical protein KC635_11995, partial [Myxococcales bacterium]|nr:hypothetical protein [Myxococcales bacterium]